MSWKQVTGWAGVGYVLVFIVLLIVGGGFGPSLSDTPAETREWFEDNQTQVALVTVLLALAFSLILLFASGLRSILGPLDEESEGMWSRLSVMGAVAMASVGTIGLSAWAVVSLDDVLAAASDETIKALATFDTVIFSALTPWALGVFVLGASIVILRSGVFPKWVAWLGLVVAFFGPAGTLWVFSGDNESFFGALGFIAFPPGFLLWTLGVAISLLRSENA